MNDPFTATPGMLVDGRYVLVAEVADGLFSARDTALANRAVAIELLPAGASQEQDLAFLRRAHAGMLLQHPAIATIYTLGNHAGRRYSSWELVDGVSLAQLATIGPISEQACLQLAHDLTSALVFAHERGTAHGALSPAKVLLHRDWPERLRHGQPLVSIIGFGVEAAPPDALRADVLVAATLFEKIAEALRPRARTSRAIRRLLRLRPLLAAGLATAGPPLELLRSEVGLARDEMSRVGRRATIRRVTGLALVLALAAGLGTPKLVGRYIRRRHEQEIAHLQALVLDAKERQIHADLKAMASRKFRSQIEVTRALLASATGQSSPETFVQSSEEFRRLAGGRQVELARELAAGMQANPHLMDGFLKGVGAEALATMRAIAQHTPPPQQSLVELQRAAAAHRLAVVVLTSAECSPCEKVEEELYELRNSAGSLYAPILVDCTWPDNPDDRACKIVRQRFAGDLPSAFVVDPDGLTLAREASVHAAIAAYESAAGSAHPSARSGGMGGAPGPRSGAR